MDVEVAVIAQERKMNKREYLHAAVRVGYGEDVNGQTL